MKVIEKKDNYITITEGNIIEKIPVDENNEQYIEIKGQTNNFTENMNILSNEERLATQINDLEIFILMQGGLI